MDSLKPREARERMIMQGTRHRGRAVMKGEKKLELRRVEIFLLKQGKTN